MDMQRLTVTFGNDWSNYHILPLFYLIVSLPSSRAGNILRTILARNDSQVIPSFFHQHQAGKASINTTINTVLRYVYIEWLEHVHWQHIPADASLWTDCVRYWYMRSRKLTVQNTPFKHSNILRYWNWFHQQSISLGNASDCALYQQYPIKTN